MHGAQGWGSWLTLGDVPLLETPSGLGQVHVLFSGLHLSSADGANLKYLYERSDGGVLGIIQHLLVSEVLWDASCIPHS